MCIDARMALEAGAIQNFGNGHKPYWPMSLPTALKDVERAIRYRRA